LDAGLTIQPCKKGPNWVVEPYDDDDDDDESMNNILFKVNVPVHFREI
jgi:hypothetical protein